jgi:general secretion pathway protein A
MTPLSRARGAGASDAAGRAGFSMYEEHFGFVEKPFSLTPDPRFLYRSETHANAFDLLQYAIRRREGFVVITGDIGTGKTTLCRAILDDLDRRTFTALVLNPFLSEEDLLKRMLQDFGVISRDEVRQGRLASVSKQDLIDILNDFLISLLPLGASALLVVDEAQNLPLQVLEQIRILSNLETDKDKLLQIVLVGQLNLHTLLRAPEMRQLDQRVSIRYELKPLTRRETAAYIEHRLAIACGPSARRGAGAVEFTPTAIDRVHRFSGGIPRLINLICDRALLGAYAEHASRIEPDLIGRAAESLDLHAPREGWLGRLRRRAAVLAAGAVASGLLLASAAGLAGPFGAPAREAAWPASTTMTAGATPESRTSATVPQPGFAILVGSYPDSTAAETARLALEQLGQSAWRVEVDRGSGGHWQVFAGPFGTRDEADLEAARLRQTAGFESARMVGVQP